MDKDGQPVYLAQSLWELRYSREQYPEVEFHFTSELNGAQTRVPAGR